MSKKLRLRQSWRIDEKFPLYDFSDRLTEAQYESVKDIESVEVELYFWYTKADPDVGLMSPSVDFDEYHIDEKYPECVREALGDYLNALDLGDMFREKVLNVIADFYEHEE